MADTPLFTVSQVTRKVRNLLQNQIGNVWIEGEISNLTKHSSGHIYFTLKDAGAQLSCAFFRGDAQFNRVPLQAGEKIQAFGEVTVYEQRGQYQLIVRQVQSLGKGSLQAQFEALKQKLHQEGLFASEIKKTLPRFPLTIAVITSPTGAAIKDVLNVLSRRSPWLRILIYPVNVQGDSAWREIVDALKTLNHPELEGVPRIDTILLTRGGGSIEDLWNFNEEAVARAICASTIPVVSAVGHEIDHTIADFAADLRAPTPSAGAELIAPDLETMQKQLKGLQKQMHQRVQREVQRHRERVEFLERSALVREPQRRIQELSQRLDHLGSNIDRQVVAKLNDYKNRLERINHGVNTHRPENYVKRLSERLENIQKRIDAATSNRLTKEKNRLEAFEKMLAALGPQATLDRGFTMTLTPDGSPLTLMKDVNEGDAIVTHFADGTVDSSVTNTEAKNS